MSYSLLVSVILLGLYFIMAMVSILQMVRFGIAGFGTYASTALFLTIFVITIFGSSLYLLNIDWSQSVSLFEGFSSSPYLNP